MVSFSGERREKRDTGNVLSFSACHSPKATMGERDTHLWRAVGQTQVEVSGEGPIKVYFGLKFGPKQHIILSPRRPGLCTGPSQAGIRQTSMSMSALLNRRSPPLPAPLHSSGPWFSSMIWSPFSQSPECSSSKT